MRDAGVSSAGTSAQDDDAGRDRGLCTTCDACEERVEIGSAAHMTGTIAYDSQPPAGGPHNPCWTRWGVHETPAQVERWVHNLEHGGVAFLYHCPDGCDDELEQLQTLVGKRSQALLTPYSKLPARFAVAAWGHRLVSDCFDLAAFEAFYAAHVDQAPESITAGPPQGCL